MLAQRDTHRALMGIARWVYTKRNVQHYVLDFQRRIRMSITNDLLVTFYNPHPGFAGAVIPIPTAVKRVADALDGQTLALGDAVARIQAVTRGRVEIVASHGYIRLWIPADSSPYGQRWLGHCFRVISFREAHHDGDQS